MPCPDTATPTCAPAPTRRRPPRPTPACCASPRPAPLPGPSSCCTTSAPCWRTARRWRALRLRAGHPRAGQRAVLRRIRLLHAGQRAGARRAGGLLPGVRRGGLGARDSRTRHHSYLRQQRGPDGHHARAAPGDRHRRGCSASPASPRRWTACWTGAAAGRAADGLVRIERTPGAGRRPADDAGPGRCRRACCRAARWSIPRRGYARAIRKAAPCCRRDSRAN